MALDLIINEDTNIRTCSESQDQSITECMIFVDTTTTMVQCTNDITAGSYALVYLVQQLLMDHLQTLYIWKHPSNLNLNPQVYTNTNTHTAS